MSIFQYQPIAPLINIDGMLKTLTLSEATGLVVDAYIRSHAFNFIVFDRQPEFIVALVTHDEQLWRNILKASDRRCWLHEEGTGLALFEPNTACGVTTIYQWTPKPNQRRRYLNPKPEGYAWQCFASESQLLSFLTESSRPKKYSGWVEHQ